MSKPSVMHGKRFVSHPIGKLTLSLHPTTALTDLNFTEMAELINTSQMQFGWQLSCCLKAQDPRENTREKPSNLSDRSEAEAGGLL